MTPRSTAILLALTLPAFACSVSTGDDDSETSEATGADTAGETAAETSGDGDGDTTESAGDGDGDSGDGDGDGDGDGGWGSWDTDGTPEETWCYGSPGPHPQFAFQTAAGTHMVRTPADCAGWFVPGNPYVITVDETTGHINVTNEFSALDHTWDDIEDQSCEHDGTGVILTVADDVMNAVEVWIDSTGSLERAIVYTDSASGCTLVP